MPQSEHLRVPALWIQATQRGAIVGQTGTGKSTLARHLLRGKGRLLLVDPKGDFEIPKWLTEGADRVRVCDDPVLAGRMLRRHNVLFRPHPERAELWHYNSLFRAVFHQKKVFVYIDELALCANGPQSYPLYLRALYQQGRSKGIGVLGVTQRPSGVPVFCFSECEKMWVFRLRMPQDLKRVAQLIGPEALEPPGDNHGFWYHSIFEEEPQEFVLRL